MVMNPLLALVLMLVLLVLVLVCSCWCSWLVLVDLVFVVSGVLKCQKLTETALATYPRAQWQHSWCYI